MVNQLENLCEERGIKVEFITHKFIDGDSELKYDQPVIKVHRIFKECPIKVATAVVEIFTGEGYTPECIEVIERYLMQKFGPVGIRIQPPKVIRIKPVNKEVSTANKAADTPNKAVSTPNKAASTEKKLISTPNKEKEEKHRSEDDMYIEANISSIDVTNMIGHQEKLNGNEIILSEEQDLLELDIEVRPPIT